MGPVRSRIAALGVALGIISGAGSDGEGMRGDLAAGAISGRVLAVETQQPMQGARVTLAGGPGVIVTARQQQATLSDINGAFEFSDLPPGRYWVRAERDHLLTTYYGQGSPGDPARSILLQPDQRINRVDVALPRLGIMVGRVLDPHGQPVERASVSAMAADLRITETNDLGEFRIPRLLPGRYLVWAIPPMSRSGELMEEERYAITFAPNTQDASVATPVIVTSGEAPPVEIMLVRARLWDVSGQVITTAGIPAAGAEVSLVIEQAGTKSALSLTRDFVSTSADGHFRFSQVPEGAYRVRARFRDEVGVTDLRLSGAPMQAMSIVTSPGVTVEGELSLDSVPGAECRTPTVVALPLELTGPEQGFPRSTQVQPNGTFRLTGLFGRQLFQVQCATGGFASIQSLRADAREWRNEPVDMLQLGRVAKVRILARPLPTKVSGLVTDPSGERATGLAVIVLDDSASWRPPFQYLWTATVVNGEFQFQGLPPGDYFGFHEPPRQVGEINTPDYLQFARARAKLFKMPTIGSVDLALTCH